MAQNCAALAETLLESELFGLKKGSFTGATEEKKGLFEIADGGTLFLDEITETPLSLQSKLLRALQEGEIRPVGATAAKHVNVRIVAATNRNLEEEVKRGRFREDLYYRLKVFPIRLPPLRERRDDIPLLATYFLERYGAEIGEARRRLRAAGDGADEGLRLARQRARAPERGAAPRDPAGAGRVRDAGAPVRAHPSGRGPRGPRGRREGHAEGHDGLGGEVLPPRASASTATTRRTPRRPSESRAKACTRSSASSASRPGSAESAAERTQSSTLFYKGLCPLVSLPAAEPRRISPPSGRVEREPIRSRSPASPARTRGRPLSPDVVRAPP
ncbi:MAG: sigma 54-interacting transcriptional regulator [Polyangiaceae bacterium]